MTKTWKVTNLKKTRKGCQEIHSECRKTCTSWFKSGKLNDAVNNTIGSKTPKIRHYGGIESSDFKVADCAVGQKNIGHNYVSQVRAFALAVILDR